MTTTTTRDVSSERAPKIEIPARLLQPLTENAYRVLGLGASASQQEIYEAAASIRRALRLERQTTTPYDARWLGALMRTESAVRDALGRLAHPSQRIHERLFWFYEAHALAADAACATWREEAEASPAEGSASGRHDAALLGYARLIACEAATRDDDSWGAGWVETLTLWRELVEADEFWSLLLATDLKGDFEKLATHAEIRSLRGRALTLVSAPLVELARDALMREDVAACGRALAALRRAPLPSSLVAEYESEILGAVEDDFEARCQEMWLQLLVDNIKAHRVNERIRVCNQTLSTFKDDIRPRLRRIVALAGTESHITRRVCETGASYLRQLAVVFPSHCGEVALRLLEQAWMLAPPGSDEESQVEGELRRHGRDEFIKARTNDEYYASLPAQLRPQAQLFASYIDEGDAATYPDMQSSGGGVSSWVGLAVLSLILVLCGWYGASRPSVKTNLRTLDMSNYKPIRPPNVNLDIAPIPPPLTTAKLDPRFRVPSVSVAQLRRRLKRGQVVVVDTRRREEYEAGHIPDAISIPEDEIAPGRARLPRRRQVVIYGDMKYSAIYFIALGFRVHGIKNVSVLEGGYEAWLAAEER